MQKTYTLKHKINLNISGKLIKVETITFKMPLGEHITSDFIPVCKLLKEVEQQSKEISDYVNVLNQTQFQNGLPELEKFYKIIAFFQEQVLAKTIQDKITLETKIFDGIKEIYFPVSRERATSCLTYANDKDRDFLTIAEFHCLHLEDIFAINTLLKDFFFSILNT